MTSDWHIGRSFASTHIEDACPCPQEPCGLVARDRVRPECPEHTVWAGKSLRQGHRPDACPGTVTREDVVKDVMNAYRDIILREAAPAVLEDDDLTISGRILNVFRDLDVKPEGAWDDAIEYILTGEGRLSEDQ